MGLFSSKKRVVTTQRQDAPWKEQIPYLKKAFQEAEAIYKDDNPQYFPEKTVVEFADETKTALEKQAKRAKSGSELTKTAQDAILSYLKKSAEGDGPASEFYKDLLAGKSDHHKDIMQTVTKLVEAAQKSDKGQDYFESLMDENTQDLPKAFKQHIQVIHKDLSTIYHNDVLSKIHTQFSKAGRYGSGAHSRVIEKAQTRFMEQLSGQILRLYEQYFYFREKQKQQVAQTITQNNKHNRLEHLKLIQYLAALKGQDLQTQLLGANQLTQGYQSNKMAHLSMAKLASLLSAQDYQDIQQLLAVGSAREALAQTQLNDEVERWNFKNHRQANKLAQFLGLVGGGYGGESLSSSTQPLYSSQTNQVNAQMAFMKGFVDILSDL